MKVTLDQFKKCLFHRNLEVMNFEDLSCRIRGLHKDEEICKSDTQETFDSLLELYAHFYSIMEANLHILGTALNFQEDLRKRRVECESSVERKWIRHLTEYAYISVEDFHPESLSLIQGDFQDASTREQLLLLLYVWVRRLDLFLGYMDYRSTATQGLFPYEVSRGRLIKKYRNTLGLHVQEQTHKSLTDPNYLDLRNDISSVFLIPRTSDSYKVKPVSVSDAQHIQMVNLTKDWDHVRFGFFPGLLESFDEYDWHSEDRGHGETLFHFKEVQRESYRESVLQAVQALAERMPHFIMLPELTTPFGLQDQIGQLFSSGKADGLVMPGSFHVSGEELGDGHEPGRVYNYSQVWSKNGRKLVGVYKMNRFEFTAKEPCCESLKPYLKSKGVEQIDYTHRTLQLIETPMGLVAVLICVDAIVDQVEQILKDYHVALVFVMAMTGNPGGSHFEEKMKRLGKCNQAVTVVCNNPLGLQLTGKSHTVVVYFPLPNKVYTDERRDFIIDVGEMYRNG
ncbi:hypothetical protein E6C60_2971 [Paenibacillus algicola]|uniref:Uncharacterized protein n=2 Tax=Paenibacillus algicola TaxID=2565926 RepID=A0A4P8XLN7_9BACL|nr:hypothetical protein E6C60_2971 [Paenibacillus algicola]